jgi:site-specific DNA-methyltransferase (adenine-specific)
MIELHNNDCLLALKKYSTGYFDLGCVDPPYGIGFDGENTKMSLGMRADGTQRVNDAWKNVINAKPKYKRKAWDSKRPSAEYFNELMRVCKHVIIWGGNYFADLLPPSGGYIVWDKGVVMPTLSKCELAYTNCNNHIEMISLLWAGYRRCEEVNRIHPTQKPVALYDWIFSHYAKAGYRVLDTHLGSGSSAIAAYKAGLYFVGYEIDKEYFEGAKARLCKAMQQGNIFTPQKARIDEQLTLFESS